jgi:hypothetical protein
VAQKTALAANALPGRVHSFAPKAAAQAVTITGIATMVWALKYAATQALSLKWKVE